MAERPNALSLLVLEVLYCTYIVGKGSEKPTLTMKRPTPPELLDPDGSGNDWVLCTWHGGTLGCGSRLNEA